MSNFGIKVGSVNVNTDTDGVLKLTSKFSSLKVFKWGDAQFTTNGSGVGSVTIAHNLGYTPIVVVLRKFTAQYTFLSATSYTNAFRVVGSGFHSYDSIKTGFLFETDDTNLTISTVSALGGIGASPNTTYYFRYMIFVDLSEAFSSASNIALTGDMGLKVAQQGKDVFGSEEYDMALSSKYRIMQYYDGHVKTSSLTLPEMWASSNDTEAEEASYIDFNHNLGYAPYFLAFTDLPAKEDYPAGIYEIPFSEIFPVGANYEGQTEVSAWSDASRVRVLFRRISRVVSGFYGRIFSAKTINVYVIIFTESLTGEASP